MRCLRPRVVRPDGEGTLVGGDRLVELSLTPEDVRQVVENRGVLALGLTFLVVQGYEYTHAYSELNLKLTSGAYGTTFFMLTGFHGFHVTLGAIMLTVILGRTLKGHFTPERHFAFEGVAWYWHFVDVVWLGLYFLVYWL